MKIIKENRKDYESIRSHRNRMEEGNILEARSAIYVLQALFSGEQNRRERLERREKRSERRQNNGISSSKLEAKAHVENHIGHHRARRRHRKKAKWDLWTIKKNIQGITRLWVWFGLPSYPSLTMPKQILLLLWFIVLGQISYKSSRKKNYSKSSFIDVLLWIYKAG